jgi:hypothetical protein
MSEDTISKLDGARRQIDAAIRMYLHREDQVSIHTLVMAAIQVLRDLSKASGRVSIEDAIRSGIRPGKEKEFWVGIKSRSNFLKHASTDPADTIPEITGGANALLLVFACMVYQTMGQLTPEMRTFVPYCLIVFPDLLVDENAQPWYELVKQMRARFIGVPEAELLDSAAEVLMILKKNAVAG